MPIRSSGTLHEPRHAARRPQVHFTAPKGWLSDPNGLIHIDGRFHLYYQHHPHDISWGPMHWGHATSPDLITWTHHPVALAPDERGTIYSGSAVLDVAGSAGFGTGALVAAFTHHRDSVEEQSLAWSTNSGETFTKLPDPILEAPPGHSDFRDPRLIAREDGAEGWLMLLAVGHAIWIYVSDDLQTWERTGTVSGVFCEDGTWEMPELMSFDVDGSRVWVLVVSLFEGAPAGGSGVQAVVGDFDGSTFIPSGEAFWVDDGPDFYAPQAWSCAPDGRRIWIGWMGNWHRLTTPSDDIWYGQMSIPRELSLDRVETGYRLLQSPVRELERYRVRSLIASGAELHRLLSADLPITAPALDLVLRAARASEAELCFRRGDLTVTVQFSGRREENLVVISGPGASPPTELAFAADDPNRELRILLDAASVEIFAGATAISAQLPGATGDWSVQLAPLSDSPSFERVEVHSLSTDP